MNNFTECQIKFKLLHFKVDTSPSLETSPEVHSTSSFDEISQSSPPSQQDHHLTQYQKTFQNELLKTFRILKFAASYFATSKDSVLTNQEVFSEILSNAIENDQIGLTTLSIVKNLIDQNPTQEDLRTAINEFEFLQQTDKELIDYSANLAKELIETNSMEVTNISEERAGLVRDDQNYHIQIETSSAMLRANSQPQIDLLAPEAKTTIEQKFSSLNDDSLKKAIFDAHLKLKSLTDKKTQQMLQDQNSPSESPKKHKIDSMLQGTESAEGPLFKKSKKELGVSP